MKILIMALIFNLLLSSLSFAKRRRTSRFKRGQALVLNTQQIFTYDTEAKKIESKINLAYAYNMGNFEFQPYLFVEFLKTKTTPLKTKTVSIGADMHFNIIENRRGKRWIPYILSGGAFVREGTKVGFKVRGGAGLKYFVTSRFVADPTFIFDYKKIKKTTATNFLLQFNFRYYF